MKPPEKPVSHDRMQEILAKRTNASLSVAEHRPAVLEWNKPVLTGIEAGTKSGYQRSTDGHYSVTRDISGDSVSYSAWRLLPDLQRHGKPWKQMAEPLGCVDSGQAAKALCEADSALRP